MDPSCAAQAFSSDARPREWMRSTHLVRSADVDEDLAAVGGVLGLDHELRHWQDELGTLPINLQA